MKKNKNLLVLTALVALVAALVVGCGSSDNSSDSSSSASDATMSQDSGSTAADTAKPTESVVLDADPGGALAYVQKTLSAKPGELSIAFTNESPIGHDVTIDDSAGNQVAQSDVITGSSTTVQFKAKPGKYTYYCSLPGHEAAGMKGTLTVQ